MSDHNAATDGGSVPWFGGIPFGAGSPKSPFGIKLSVLSCGVRAMGKVVCSVGVFETDNRPLGRKKSMLASIWARRLRQPWACNAQRLGLAREQEDGRDDAC